MQKLKLKKILSKYYVDDSSLELVIQKLKDEGASQMECLKALVLELKIPLSQADGIVVNSNAWKENLDAVNMLRDKFLEALEEAYLEEKVT